MVGVTCGLQRLLHLLNNGFCILDRSQGAKRGYSRFWAGLCGVAIPIGILVALLAAVFLTSGKAEFDELLAWEVVVKISISFGVAIISSLAARTRYDPRARAA
jgi:hypothetical protein